MKKVVLLAVTCVLLFFVSCADTALKPEEAEKLIKERLSKMPGRSVSFYLGAMTDPAYLPDRKSVV